MSAIETLKQYFGYNTFRSGQETLINDILAGKDVLGIMPTGAGKSICFQVPALMMNGLTLVISPLISLMKDQVNSLTQSGIAAAFINSSITEQQIYKVLHNAEKGTYKLVYVAPERLLTPDFISFVKSMEISMLTIDEAHCISQWGQDFRPSYARIPEFIKRLQKRPVVSAFTATATPVVREDIINQLVLNNPTVLLSNFDRQNLYFEVKKPKDKFSALCEFLKDKKELTGIIYCSTRATVEEVCKKLKEIGYNASHYHAGLSDTERRNNQDSFIHDRIQIMVATNAFGMGIDKSNVSYVVHYNMPKDMEGYYQEAGRAGRDGEPADCILLYGGQDVFTNQWMIENARNVDYSDIETEEKLKERNRERLRKMTFYCTTSDCLRSYILKYFGETPGNYCGNCINCNTNFETIDITIDAQKIISCVARMKERYGVNMIIDVMRGSKNEKVLRLGLNHLSTYGISEKSAKQLREIIDHMILSDYLLKTDDEYPVIKLGSRAKEVLLNNESIYMKLPKESEKPTVVEKKGTLGTVVPVNRDLHALLVDLRTTIAKEQGVPAYIIFHNSTLTDICMKLPKTPEEFLNVSGVGKAKAKQYGEQFLRVIAEFLSTNNIEKIYAENPKETQPNLLKESDTLEIEVSEELVGVNIIADRITCALIEKGHCKVTGRQINDWLVSKGFLEVIKSGNKNYKISTNTGTELGITTEDRVIRGVNVKVNLFNLTAQQFITLNALKISNFKA